MCYPVYDTDMTLCFKGISAIAYLTFKITLASLDRILLADD